MKKHNFGHYILTIFYSVLKNILQGLLFLLVMVIGYLIYLNTISPYNLIFGMPLVLIGGGLLINSLNSVALSIFSPSFNKGVCVICS